MFKVFMLGLLVLERAAAACEHISPGRSPKMPRNVTRKLLLGDSGAFADFCDPVVDIMFSYAFACTGDRDGAKAIVAQTCELAWSRRHEFVDGLGFNGFAWIMRIAREILFDAPGTSFSLHPHAVAGDQSGVLARLARLDSCAQEMAVLRFSLGVTLEDAAQIMDIQPNHAIVVQYGALLGLDRQSAA